MNLIYQCIRLLLAILYPIYMSFKAVRSKNVKEYVKWMMYWIVFASFTFLETFTDLLLCWIPFYYEQKTLILVWLVIPSARGSCVIFRKLLYPELLRKEQVIDEYVHRLKDRGYATLIALGARGFTFATNIVLSTAVKGQATLVERLKRSYSLNDLGGYDLNDRVGDHHITSALSINNENNSDAVGGVEDNAATRRSSMTPRIHSDFDNQLANLIRRFDQNSAHKDEPMSTTSKSMTLRDTYSMPATRKLNKFSFH